MQATKAIISYRRMRLKPHWRLLAADHGPIIIAILQTYFRDNKRSIPASLFYEYLTHELEALRAQGEDIPQTAQAYAADWLTQGYLERHLPTGATEEVYELSLAAATAIRFVTGLTERRTVATESRLATVIHQLTKLAEETDPNPETRIATLLVERERIDREITAIKQGNAKLISEASALERTREIIGLTDDLIGDFHRVRNEFEHLNRDLRRQIMDSEGNRGTILDALFEGVDVISNSDAGRTFSAFWRLLIDPEQSAVLEQALEDIISREFARQLDVQERSFLLSLTRTLLNQSSSVHDVLQNFARSLKHFVQSREYLEHRRLNQLLKDAQHAALAIKDEVKITNSLEYSLMLTSCKLRSISQWSLHDPSLYSVNHKMESAPTELFDLKMIADLVAQSEIDFNFLKANIKKMLQDYLQVSIGEILKHFPANQGLGSIIGYIALGSRHGEIAEHSETVQWIGNDDQQRSAKIPVIYFLRKKYHEL